MIETTSEALVRHGPVIGELGARPTPAWVTDGWYSNNPMAQKGAVARWSIPVTTRAEREVALRHVAQGESFPCHACGKFAFPKPKLCFWCRRSGETSNG